jgi:hypothetical protein
MPRQVGPKQKDSNLTTKSRNNNLIFFEEGGLRSERRNTSKICLLWIDWRGHHFYLGYAYPQIYKKLILIQYFTPPWHCPGGFFLFQTKKPVPLGWLF